MGKTYFKSPMMKTLVAKMDAPGVEGIVVGYETQPGGSWTGDYLMAVLADFEVGKKKARVFITKSVVFPNQGDITKCEFPIADAI